MKVPENLENGLDDGNFREYVKFYGGTDQLADRVEVWIHACQSFTVPDFPQDQMDAMDALFEREDLNNHQIVAEMSKILV